MRPGGQLIFTVPFTGAPDTLVRARVMPDGTISHLLPPEYHADPLTVDGCLCFYHFGWDLLDTLRSLGFVDVRALVYWSREYGYISGDPQMIFAARK